MGNLTPDSDAQIDQLHRKTSPFAKMQNVTNEPLDDEDKKVVADWESENDDTRAALLNKPIHKKPTPKPD